MKSESEVKKKVIQNRSFIYPETYIYIIDHMYIYNPICIKIVNQLSYEFKSLQTFGDPTQKNQNHSFYMIFLISCWK